MHEMSPSYLRRTESRLIDARSAPAEGSHPDVIRYSQEAVEMSLKAILRAVGIECPKDHEVSAVLKAERNGLPKEIAGEIEELSRISLTLYDARGPAMYGDEKSGTPPEEIFGDEDAERSLDKLKASISSANLGTLHHTSCMIRALNPKGAV